MPIRLGDLLVSNGVLTPEQRDHILELQSKRSRPFGVLAEVERLAQRAAQVREAALVGNDHRVAAALGGRDLPGECRRYGETGSGV